MGGPSILSKKRIPSGNWLYLEELTYLDHHGVRRKWECSRRTDGTGAVAIIALLKPSNRIILVRQFRPPAGGHVIEFPAGLCGKGEKPEVTAIRELYEETGYSGRITGMSRPIYSSPGMTGENVRIVHMDIDERHVRNRNPETAFDDGEHIETFLVPVGKIGNFLEKMYKKGDRLDAKVVSFARGLALTVKNNRKKKKGY